MVAFSRKMKISVFQFVLYALAVFRIALMVSKEDGPAWIFRKLRKVPPPRSSARQGLSCPFCVSVWAAIPMTAQAFYQPLWGELVVMVLALSAVAVILNQAFTKGDL